MDSSTTRLTSSSESSGSAMISAAPQWMQLLGHFMVMPIDDWSGTRFFSMADICADIKRSKAVLGIGGAHDENMIFSSSIDMGFSSRNILFIRFMIGFATGDSVPSGTSCTLSFSVMAFILMYDLSYTLMVPYIPLLHID